MTSPLLEGLNEPQRQAVLHDSGPVLIFAGAGSGKTNALTKRIAYLIRERQVRPYNILAVTFTNKAAAEMKERIARLVGDLAMRDLWAGTFHSLCARILRERGQLIGLDKSFVIYDDGDQLALIKESLRELDLDDKQFAPRAVLSQISKAKETLQTPQQIKEDFTASPFERAVGSVYQLYQEKLTLSNALDFDDLIMKTVQLLRESEPARTHYQNRFRYVHCDEFQDVNDSQYQLLTLFSGKWRNICVVGDDDQCVVEGTPILTPSGYVPVEQIKEGDEVLAACGDSNVMPAIVEKVMVSEYAGAVRKICMSQGQTLYVTPNHVMFGTVWEVAGQDPPSEEWQNPALCWDKYAVNETYGRDAVDLLMFPKFYVASEAAKRTETFDNYDDAMNCARQLQNRHNLSGVRAVARFGSGFSFMGMMPAGMLNIWHCLPTVYGSPGAEPPGYTDRTRFAATEQAPQPRRGFVPSSPAVQGGVSNSHIASITDEHYTGKVYDLSVKNLRNYVAGGIVVHNSIYAFRGANVQIILNFERDFPDATIIKLEQNYRSTKTILDAAYHVVRNNRGRADKRLWTENIEGENITLIEAPNEVEEAAAVVNVIRDGTITGDKRYADHAVLYRANSQSRALEEQFINYRIPYKIVGGVRFYERREIKDILAYLRVILNPYDGLSMRRIINVPTRAVGVSTIEKIGNFAARYEIAFWDACRRVAEMDLPARAKNSVAAFVKIIEYLHNKREAQTVSDLIQNVLDTTGYLDELRKEKTQDAESRVENVGELLNVAKEFEDQQGDDGDRSLAAFLENVSLVSDIDTLEDSANSVTLMTLHAAKGLEFPVVFLCGLEEGVFPHIRAMSSQSELEEERRLCYVGITRAKDELYMSYAGSRMLFGQVSRNPVSRFVSEIPMSLFLAKTARKGAAADYVPTLADGSRRPQSVIAPKWNDVRKPPAVSNSSGTRPFKLGDKVKHDKFGTGTVVSYDSDTVLTVAFPAPTGLKKLDLGFAKMEKA
ncbi:MAG: UvrD-helicase domain-containing protein [Armatimonadetes bacterium]|nr:UvrD-helicase domain-containing protein [Armatimonadota bacterium]